VKVVRCVPIRPASAGGSPTVIYAEVMERPAASSSSAPTDPYPDADHLVDADEDRWAWRARLKRNPVTRRVYRVAVGLVGSAIVVVGLVLLPAPGPGWLIIFAGLAVLASEFEWAQRLLDYARRRVRQWTAWTARQNLFVRALVVLAIVVLVLAIFWGLFALSGVPQWLPDAVQTPIQAHVPGL
jgi:uncharacterized protein (TIGR02611 family)